MAGEGRAPGRRHLLQLAEPVGLDRRRAGEIIDQVVDAVAGFDERARHLGVTSARRREIVAAQGRCCARLAAAGS